ncbi:MAG: GNAT family N-acetyltransferase [Lachnospiraceae bacterium]|nr:GNAT family N-acetyltransferase [Lachnospiraceae bacterium]
MVRKFRAEDLEAVMDIWLETNKKAHSFIDAQYWTKHYETVKALLPQAELYVFENDHTGQTEGFIGLTDEYMEGIFVREAVQSQGIGRQLLDEVKRRKSRLSLSVYKKNTRAVSFYEREQFRIQSENLEEGTGEKEFLMVWNV